MSEAEDFMKRLRESKVTRAMLEAEKEKARSEPDTLSWSRGTPAIFRKRGKEVVQDQEGNWKLKEPKARGGKVSRGRKRAKKRVGA